MCGTSLVTVVALAVGGAGAPASAPAQPPEGEIGFEKERCIIYPLRTVVVSSQATGVIERLLVEEQDAVKAGQVLAALDNVAARLAVERLRLVVAEDSALKDAEIRLAQVREDLETARKLGGAVAESEAQVLARKYELAVVQVRRARYEKQLYDIDLKLAEKRLADREIRAPIDGVVLKKHREVGEAVDEDRQTPVVTLIDASRLRAEVLVPVSKIGQVALGQAASVLCTSFPDRAIPGRVVFIEPVVQPATSEFMVKVEFVDPAGQVRPGMRATVRLVLGKGGP